MSSNVPTVGQYMSRTTITVAPRQTIQEARDLMMKHHIRHLPVLDSGRLVGLVSQHDLDTAASSFDGNAASIRVDYAMATDVYTVRPDTPLDAVAAHLSEKRFGSTVVMEGDNVVGVFTMVDACRALIATSREDRTYGDPASAAKRPIRKILVPVDFSDPNEAAVAAACDFARTFGSEIVLMHAYVIESYFLPEAATLYDPEAGARLLEACQRMLDVQRDSITARGVQHVSTRLKDGIPATEIVAMARIERADLIVMGTHGRTGLSHAIIGSVAEKVVRTAPCPVLTVR